MPFDGAGFGYDTSLQKLDAVIDLLETPDRWCKGALRSHDGRYCIRGAIRAVNGSDVLEPAILQAIGQVAGRRYRRIEAFNDHPHTTHDQVVAVLARARSNLGNTLGRGSSIGAGIGAGIAAGRLREPLASLRAWCRRALSWAEA